MIRPIRLGFAAIAMAAATAATSAPALAQDDFQAQVQKAQATLAEMSSLLDTIIARNGGQTTAGTATATTETTTPRRARANNNRARNGNRNRTNNPNRRRRRP